VAKSIAEQLDISREPVGSIIHEDFDIRNLNFYLSGLQKLEQRAKKCIQLLGENIE
jgi:hypothetical protein